MRIITDGQSSGDWVVLADWYGTERIVFRGTIYAACRFVSANS
jgi:hypothetical protein